MRVLTLIMMFAVMVMSRRCPKYQCANNTDNKTDNTGICAVWTDSGMIINPCMDGYICELSTTNISSCKKINDTSNRYPGEYCNEHAQCDPSKCEKNVCVGSKVNGTCNHNRDCDVELYCSGGKCKEPEPTKVCSLKDKIPCKSNEVCNRGKCIPQGSLGNDEVADTPIACKSQYLSKDKKCAKVPTYKDKGENFCTYSISGAFPYNDSKACTKDEKGTSHCIEREKLTTSSFTSFMDSGSRHKCSIEKGPFCINKESISEMSLEFKRAYVEYIEMRFPELTENVSPCFKKTFFQDYWKAKTDVLDDDDKFGLYLFLAVATGAIVVIAILLLVIYFRRKSDDTPEEEQLEELE